MTKEQRNSVAEYATQLNEDDLRWLGLRLTERLGGDLGEAIEFLSKDSRIDPLLAAAASSTELYDAADKIRDFVTKECKKRGVALKYGPQLQ